jgi:hypothetical protein
MAGTIVTDRIESDASFASKIELASPVLVSNTFAVKSTGGTGTFNIVGANTNTDRTMTLPDVGGNVVLDSATQTLTNKTIDAAQLTGNVAAGRITTALNASGDAPIFACRAWVNFNGISSASIRASGNVSSVSRNGTGDYTINFATAMPDANYSPIASAQPNTGDGIGPGNGQVNLSIVGTTGSGALPSTAGYRIYVGYAGGNPRDVSGMYTAVFR